MIIFDNECIIIVPLDWFMFEMKFLYNWKSNITLERFKRLSYIERKRFINKLYHEGHGCSSIANPVDLGVDFGKEISYN